LLVSTPRGMMPNTKRFEEAGRGNSTEE
jgi:hypothetical protein